MASLTDIILCHLREIEHIHQIQSIRLKDQLSNTTTNVKFGYKDQLNNTTTHVKFAYKDQLNNNTTNVKFAYKDHSIQRPVQYLNQLFSVQKNLILFYLCLTIKITLITIVLCCGLFYSTWLKKHTKKTMYNEMYLNYILTLLDQTISSVEKKSFWLT